MIPTVHADKYDLYCADCLDVMQGMDTGIIDLTVTSPPYDNLRTYNGYTFDFQPIARELYRVTKPGGVVVWVVGDATINGSETGTSFRQALYFMECGFNLHDTMIYHKTNPVPNEVGKRYQPSFEYMFIFAKGGLPNVFNPIKIKAECFGKVIPKKNGRQFRKPNGDMKEAHGLKYNKPYKLIHNIWDFDLSGNQDHPAVFPEDLARDHILSWSNPGDLVFDPMCGSGTTGKMAIKYQRRFIGIDISSKYVDIAAKRIERAALQMVMPL